MIAWKSKSTLGLIAMAAAIDASTVSAQDKVCSSDRTKIVGGENARIKDWPGQAAIRIASEEGRVAFYFCGGTAISDRWVLTAAHCLPQFTSNLSRSVRNSQGKSYEGRLEVVLGAGDLKEVPSEHVFPVEQLIIHESYRAAIDAAMKFENADERDRALDGISMTVGNDIALLKLARSWNGPVARLSLSAATDPLPPPVKQVRVAGFGKTEHNVWKNAVDRFERKDAKGELYAGSDQLLETAVETVPTAKCHQRYAGSHIGDGQICAGLEEGGQDSCQGDSGGPLTAYDADGCPYQVGVVSWGDGCAKAQAYGVYTRVSAHAQWIQAYTGPLQGPKPSARSTESSLSLASLDQALRQLETLLGNASGNVAIGVRGGNRLKLGDEVVFEALSSVAGRLLLLDINADREVTLIYPNKYVAADDLGRISAGQRVLVPGPNYPGFSAFHAVEPTGKGRLLVLVVPEDFDIKRFAAAPSVVTKGFQPVSEPPSYFMRLIRQIEQALSSSARTAGGVQADQLKQWAYGITEYEIVQ
jgi:secreted trypsin-like serine protease